MAQRQHYDSWRRTNNMRLNTSKMQQLSVIAGRKLGRIFSFHIRVLIRTNIFHLLYLTLTIHGKLYIYLPLVPKARQLKRDQSATHTHTRVCTINTHSQTSTHSAFSLRKFKTQLSIPEESLSFYSTGAPNVSLLSQSSKNTKRRFLSKESL